MRCTSASWPSSLERRRDDAMVIVKNDPSRVAGVFFFGRQDGRQRRVEVCIDIGLPDAVSINETRAVK
jgi:hypothetical protein